MILSRIVCCRFWVQSLLQSHFFDWDWISLFCSIFILLSRESDGDAIFWMNLHLLRNCSFPSFLVVSLTSYHRICCLFEAIKQR